MAKTSILTILIQLAKKGDADRATIKGLAEIKSNVGLAIGAFAALTGAAYVVDKALDQTVGVFVSYAAQVRELQRLTGATAEDTSRLIQAADDVTISYESLQKALWFASKNGIEVNIDSIARLADEYNALEGPTERAEFLAKKFGKGGAEMAKLLEQGREGVRDLTDAISDSLVLTDAAVQQAREYEIQMDNLNDQWEAFKIGVGQKVIPALNDFLYAINNNAAVLEERDRIMKEGLTTDYSRANAMAINSLRVKEWRDSLDLSINTMREYEVVSKNAASATDNVALSAEEFKAQLDQLNEIMGGDLGQAQDDYNEKIAEYTVQLAEARTEEQKRDIQSKIDAETQAYNQRAAAIMFNIQQQALLAAAEADPTRQQEVVTILGEMAQSYGLIDEAQKHAMVSTSSLVDQWANGLITAEQFKSMMAAQTQGVMASSQALDQESQIMYHAGERALDAVTKFEEMEEAQAGLGAGVRADALPAVDGLKKAIAGLPPTGSNWAYSFAISVSGSVPRLPTRGNYVGQGHGYANNAGVDSEFASGGQLAGAGWTMVGEQGEELVSPWGYVFSHSTTEELLRGGMMPEFARKYAGPIGESTGDWGYYSGEGPVVQAARRKRRQAIAPATVSGGSQTSQQSTAEVVAPLAASTEAAVQSATAAQQQQVTEGIQTRNVISQGNSDIADKLTETNDLLRSLNTSLPRSISAAIQQTNP